MKTNHNTLNFKSKSIFKTLNYNFVFEEHNLIKIEYLGKVYYFKEDAIVEIEEISNFYKENIIKNLINESESNDIIDKKRVVAIKKHHLSDRAAKTNYYQLTGTFILASTTTLTLSAFLYGHQNEINMYVLILAGILGSFLFNKK